MHLTPLEIEELATFYDFIYREPVGKYVIHVCDGVVCWMFHEVRCLIIYARNWGSGRGRDRGRPVHGTCPPPVSAIATTLPAMLINGVMYGPLTPEKIDAILEKLATESLSICLSHLPDESMSK